MSAVERGPVAGRLFTADEVAGIVEWFGGNVGRWRQHVDADSDVVNVGQTPDLRAVKALELIASRYDWDASACPKIAHTALTEMGLLGPSAAGGR